jgi:7-keto-8-aminopelargonate synthetase-like enzyme
MGFKELLLCGSLGNAMGITAGMIAGNARRLEALEKTPFFAGASPAPPAGLWTLSKALEYGIYQEKWKLLISRMKFLQDRVGGLGCLAFQNRYPVLCFRDPKMVRHLLKKRILITDFEYPAEGETVSPSRIVVTAAHGEHQLQYLAEALLAFENC